MSQEDVRKRLEREPHHELNNPVGDPDPAEWPDPYDQREDPRAPRDPGDPGDTHTPVGSTSTSDPHPTQDPEAGDRAEPPDHDKLQD